MTGAPSRSRLRTADVGRLAGLGLRSRRLRTVLSAGGIGIGVATMVAVLGISQSSRADLLAQLDRLGTNLLTVTPGRGLGGEQPTLPKPAPAMVSRIGPVQEASAIGDVNASVYRNDRIPAADTDALVVYAARTNLLGTLQGRLARGQFLNSATAGYPAVVLGATTAAALGVDRADGTTQLWLGRHWFSVIGILAPVPLAPELDRAALIGFPVATRLLGAEGSPVTVYVRAAPDNVNSVEAVLAATANPGHPEEVSVNRPSDALAARAAAKAAFRGLFLALGGIALAVGGVGIANVMIIAVLERRSEIGLRRALGATRTHIGAQFVAESVLLSLLGGTAGVASGVLITSVYAHQRQWTTSLPPLLLVGGVGAAMVVGAAAGLYPALRAARLSPTEALASQ